MYKNRSIFTLILLIILSIQLNVIQASDVPPIKIPDQLVHRAYIRWQHNKKLQQEEQVLSRYERAKKWAVRHKKEIIAVAFMLALLGFGANKLLKEQQDVNVARNAGGSNVGVGANSANNNGAAPNANLGGNQGNNNGPNGNQGNAASLKKPDAQLKQIIINLDAMKNYRFAIIKRLFDAVVGKLPVELGNRLKGTGVGDSLQELINNIGEDLAGLKTEWDFSEINIVPFENSGNYVDVRVVNGLLSKVGGGSKKEAIEVLGEICRYLDKNSPDVNSVFVAQNLHLDLVAQLNRGKIKLRRLQQVLYNEINPHAQVANQQGSNGKYKLDELIHIYEALVVDKAHKDSSYWAQLKSKMKLSRDIDVSLLPSVPVQSLSQVRWLTLLNVPTDESTVLPCMSEEHPCNELFELLPCHHTLCGDCYEDIMVAGGAVMCPFCRARVSNYRIIELEGFTTKDWAEKFRPRTITGAPPGL